MKGQGAAKEGSHSGTIAVVALAVFVAVVAWVAVRVAQRPVSTLAFLETDLGVALDVTIACEIDAASRDAPVILARLEELRIDGLAEPTSARTVRLRLSEDPGAAALEAVLARGELAIADIVEEPARRGTAEELAGIEAPTGTRAVLECDPAGECRALVVRDPPAVRGSDVDGTQLVVDPATGEPRIAVALTNDGGHRLRELTSASVGRRIAITIDERVVSAPVVQEPIASGRLAFGARSTDEGRAVAVALATRPLDCAWRVESRGASDHAAAR